MLKKIVLASGIIALGIADAANLGPYLGATAGYSRAKANSTTNYTLTKDKGFAWGAFMGYNFLRYVGMEVGYDRYAKAQYNDTSTSTANNGTDNIRYYDIDILAKGYLPLSDSIDLFAGVGAAYVHASESGATKSKNSTATWWRPKGLLGINYQFNDDWTVSLFASRVLGKGSVSSAVSNDDGQKYLPDLDMVGLSLDYSFGNV